MKTASQDVVVGERLTPPPITSGFGKHMLLMVAVNEYHKFVQNTLRVWLSDIGKGLCLSSSPYSKEQAVIALKALRSALGVDMEDG